MTATFTGRAWSCTVRLVLTDRRALPSARLDFLALLDRVDREASRFREDSGLSRANCNHGRPLPVSPLLVHLVGVALQAASDTDGLVDPTVGTALCRAGYDRDIAHVPASRRTAAAPTPRPCAGQWRRVGLDRAFGLLTVPAGCALDLGATTKAYVADLAAEQLAGRFGCGVLVELGGDVAMRGGPPPDGWVLRVAEREGAPGQLISVPNGGVATSTTTVRRWRRSDGRNAHHIIDPRTGEPAPPVWRTVTVAAGTALDANVAATAAIVLGAEAESWLAGRGRSSRLVAEDGTIRCTPGWPVDSGTERGAA